jgi:hypothetical protein
LTLPDGTLITSASSQSGPSAAILEARSTPDGVVWGAWTAEAPTPGAFGTVRWGDLDADGAQDVLLLETRDAYTLRVRGFTLRGRLLGEVEIPWTDAPNSTLNRVETIALDADPQSELLLLLDQVALLVDDDGTVLNNMPILHGNNEVVDVDDDGVPEIVDTAGVIYDAATLTPTGDRLGAGTTASARSVDVDGDGVREIITAAPGGSWTCHEASLAVRWTTSVVGSMGGPELLDMDGDGSLDLVFGLNGQPDDLVWLDTQTGVSVGRVPGLRQYNILPYRLGRMDADGDGELELLVADQKGMLSWDPVTGWGPLGMRWSKLGMVAADFDGDGAQELFVLGASAGFSQRDFAFYDAASGAQLFRGALPRGGDGRTRELATPDLDGDGDAELALADRGELLLVDMEGGPRLLQRVALARDRYPILRAADFDGDGRDEVLIGSESGYDIEVRGLRGPLWALSANDVNPRDLAAGDLDGDGLPEVVNVRGDELQVRDGLTGQVRAAAPIQGVWAADVINGEVVLTKTGGHMATWSLSPGGLVRTRSWRVPGAGGIGVMTGDLIFTNTSSGIIGLDIATGSSFNLGISGALSGPQGLVASAHGLALSQPDAMRMLQP